MRTLVASRLEPSNDMPDEKAVASRERILDAALGEFSEHGWGGARVDRIAERAEINKRMLYAYIGNKQALWVAVLERVYARMRQGERALNLSQETPESGMELLIRFNCRFHANHPEFISMLNEENRQHARNLYESHRVPEMYSPLMSLIEDLLQRGRASGVFHQNVGAKQLYISIAALSYFYYSNVYTLSTIFEEDLAAPQAALAREQHVVDFVMGYLRC